MNLEIAAWGAVGLLLGYYAVKHFHVAGGRVL